MNIQIQNLLGESSVLGVEPGNTVENLKAQVQGRFGVPSDQQRLIFAGKTLEDGRLLSDYGIGNLPVVFLTIR